MHRTEGWSGRCETASRRAMEKSPGYLFNHEARATVFRGRLLDALKAKGLRPPNDLPERWVVDCRGPDPGE